LVDDGLDDIAVVWKDYWFSQDGGDLASYGPEGVSFRWLPDGEYEWIFPRLFDEAEGLDFWTIMPQFKVHNWAYLRDSTAYEFRPEVFHAIETWATQNADWVMPDHLAFTPEEEEELAGIMTDINTYRDEMTLRFIVGDEPLGNFDTFVSTIEGMGLARATEIMNASLDRYLARGR
jgi:putative aldouronate transport system substrate-binding protein